MDLKKLTGVGVALVTPMQENKEIDYVGLENLLNHTSASGQGVDYWVVLGTTGESATLSKTEKKEVLDFVKKHNPYHLPIVYGIGGNHTQAVLEEINSTDLEGVAAILSVSPYYNKPSQRGIYAHYQLIADHAPLPIIMYNVPGRTSSNLSAETALKLARHPNIIALKEANCHIEQWITIAKNKPDDFLLLSGDDLATLSMMAVGAEGVISVMANAFPDVFRAMVHQAQQQNFIQAQKYVFQLAEINPLMYEEANPVGIKEALRLLGICSNQVRLPLLPASEDLQDKIRKLMPLQVSMVV
ncbi:MAG: 4-hydroxy-tetrahydrodipicolinate synthase [Microscillaceae bacterium]|nr:4-hydroxy-tetrahydrodipicolinate synthase [Microscillaceae bacterium]